MKKSIVLLIMLLCLASTVSYSQLILTRFQKEQIVKDKIRLNECDSVAKLTELQLADQKSKFEEAQGVRVALEGEITQYETVQIPSWEKKDKNWETQVAIMEKQLNHYKLGFFGVLGALILILIVNIL